MSITITAAVPRPDFSASRLSKSIRAVLALLRRDHPHRRAAGDDRLEVAPAAAHAADMIVDQLLSGIDIASSTLHGLFTWPETQISLVPVLFGAAEAGEPAGAAAQDRRRRPRSTRRC